MTVVPQANATLEHVHLNFGFSRSHATTAEVITLIANPNRTRLRSLQVGPLKLTPDSLRALNQAIKVRAFF
jgi:hypothetical protein